MPGLGLAMTGSRRLRPPAALAFPFAAYPLPIRRRGGHCIADFVAAAHAAEALSGPSYFVNIATGDDGNAGTSLAAPLKSIWQATTLGNAGGVPFQVRVQAGQYPRANNFTNNGNMVGPTQKAAYIAEGGRAVCWSGNDLAWSATPDATYGNCYSVARGNVTAVIDRLHENALGDKVDIAKVADAATCNTTPGSWAQVGATLYLHRADALAPTNDNSRALLLVDAFTLGGSAKSVYLSGFDFEGGSNGGVLVHEPATRDIVLVDCSVRYAGGPANLFDAFRIEDNDGLVALVRCLAASAAKDGFNFHWPQGGTPSLFHLTIDCEARGNGRYTSQSNNGLTSHDGIVGIDVNGFYHHNFGPNVVSISTSKLWCVGTDAEASYGDASLGGAGGARDFNTQDSAIYWLERTRSASSPQSIVADNQSTIFRRHHQAGAGQTEQAFAPASIAEF